MASTIPLSKVSFAVGDINQASFSADLTVTIPSPKIRILAVYARANKALSNLALRFYDGPTFDGSAYDSSTFLGQVDVVVDNQEANVSTRCVGHTKLDGPGLPFINAAGANYLYVIAENESTNDAVGIDVDLIVEKNPWRPTY